MKKIYFYITLLSVALFSACNDDDFNEGIAPPQTYPQEEPKVFGSFDVDLTPIFSSPIVMSEEILEQEDLTWEMVTINKYPELEEGVSIVSYVLRLSKSNEGEDFIELPLIVNENNTLAIVVEDLNDAVIDLYDDATSEARMVYATIYPSIMDNGTTLIYPEPVVLGEITITPFALFFDLEPVYLTGNLINNLPEWENSVSGIGNGLQVLFADKSVVSAAVYTYTGNFNANAEFKLPVKAGGWDPSWGMSNGELVLANGTGNISGPAEAGYYTMTINLKTQQVSFNKFDEASAKNYATIGLVGDGSPEESWDDDTPMVMVADHIWVLANAEMKAGEFKFRANNSWDDNWGAEGSADMPFGIGVYNASDNLQITTSGTYYIAFNDLTGHYIVIPRADLP
ncbi:MAG: SusF/SusE family outer membrane protein [Candidatus Azobacteroides sp.]|nr:SusF/SusE family outer membrane protein [Candidatus Azobacteroides sp.]